MIAVDVNVLVAAHIRSHKHHHVALPWLTDAYIAAIALEYACPVATFDRDFRRFDGLTVITPGH